jgi:hypothetical protein
MILKTFSMELSFFKSDVRPRPPLPLELDKPDWLCGKLHDEVR